MQGVCAITGCNLQSATFGGHTHSCNASACQHHGPFLRVAGLAGLAPAGAAHRQAPMLQSFNAHVLIHCPARR